MVDWDELYCHLYEPDEWDYHDEDDIPSGPQEKTCRSCGKRGLYWIQTKEGWKLANKKGELHVCNFTKDFKPLPAL
jgi:hypothetical protein